MNRSPKNRTIQKGDPVIEVRKLARRFGSLQALKGINLSINRGEVFGFLGPNGAGKSTLIRTMVGLLSPSSGTASVLDHRMPEEADILRKHIGYMTQNFSLYQDLTVRENLDFASEIFGLDRYIRKERIKSSMDYYGLSERQDQKPAQLSGGWKQRLALAVATIHNPEILFLDEPTAGVDPENRRRFWEKLFELAAQGKTILVSTHYMDEAVRCHRLALLKEGHLGALGTPSSLTSRFDGRVIEIDAQPAAAVCHHLDQHEDVASTTQLGNLIHLLLKEKPQDSLQLIRTMQNTLEKLNFSVHSIQMAAPNLEDVFVALTQGERMDLAPNHKSHDRKK